MNNKKHKAQKTAVNKNDFSSRKKKRALMIMCCIYIFFSSETGQARPPFFRRYVDRSQH